MKPKGMKKRKAALSAQLANEASYPVPDALFSGEVPVTSVVPATTAVPVASAQPIAPDPPAPFTAPHVVPAVPVEPDGSSTLSFEDSQTDASESYSEPLIDEGDVTLKCRGGEVIIVDSTLLSRASTVFASRLLDAEIRGDESPIPADASFNVIRDILRCLYPSSRRPLATLSDPDHAVQLLIAMRKFEITSWALEDAAANVVGAVDPPIRAWALAVQAGNEMARKIATRRFFSDASTGLEGDVRELKVVDGWQLVRVVQIKAEVVEAGRAALDRLIASCFSPHCGHQNLAQLLKARELPLQFDLLPDTLLDILQTVYPYMQCGHCSPLKLSQAEERKKAREDLTASLDKAVDKECAIMEQLHDIET